MSHNIDTIGTISATTPTQPGFAGAIRRAVVDVVETLQTWRARARGRRELSLMDAHTLRDIGVTRVDVMIEIDKPFWRG